VRNKYQRKDRKSNHKFEVVGGQELMVRVPLPIAEVWAEMQAQVEELTGQAGLQILRAILENEVTHRVGPPHRPHPTAGCVRSGKQPGYVPATSLGCSGRAARDKSKPAGLNPKAAAAGGISPSFKCRRYGLHGNSRRRSRPET